MNVAVKPLKHAAPGQYLGFALQPVRLCFHLLTCEAGASVSLEYLDDVAIHHANGHITLEQTKSATKTNPVSDLADDLWKTFANWLEMLAQGVVKAGETTFRIYVAPKRTGPWAEALSAAKTPADVEAIVGKISTKLAKMAEKPGCIAHLQAFLDAPPAHRSAVATGMVLQSRHTDPVAPLRDLLKPTVPPEHIDRLCEAAIGMAKQRADRCIQKGELPVIDADAFKATFRAFVQKNVMSNYLPALSERPLSGEIDALLALRPVFLRQLELVSVTEDEKVRAVSDLLRSSADKSRWADAGMIFEGSLEEWDENLVARQGLVAGEITDVYGDKDAAVRGRLVYRRCAQMDAPLEGRAVPSHFVHGCFNALADSRRLGWHPEFAGLLDEEQQ